MVRHVGHALPATLCDGTRELGWRGPVSSARCECRLRCRLDQLPLELRHILHRTNRTTLPVKRALRSGGERRGTPGGAGRTASAAAGSVLNIIR
jgi:hypothetical protein